MTLTPENVEAYRELMLHGYRHAADAFTSTLEERASFPTSWWRQRLGRESEASCALGAFRGDALVGTVALEFSARVKTAHKARLIALYVLETSRGLGAGQALVTAALGAARRRAGVRAVTLTVTESNGAAVALYEKLGFRTFGSEPLAIRTPAGDFLAKRHMWLEIDPRAGEAGP
ncbi:MAG: GNAT family N-acetyltransferase [Acidobacteriota bacterium]